MPKPSFYTLLFAVAIAQVLVASAPTANALQGHVPVPAADFARRAANHHVDVNKRMLKKRRPQDNTGDLGPINVVGDPNASGTTTTAAAASQAPTSTKATSTAAQTTSSQGGLAADLSALLNGSPTTTKTSSTTSSTPTPTSTQPTSTSSTPPATSTTPSGTSARNVSTSIVYVPGATTSVPAAQNPDASFLSKSTIIGLAVAGGCIAAAAAIWTIIRKWKFSPSRHFEDRLEPINWEPTQASGIAAHDPTAAALGRSASRTGTNNRPGSYISDGDHNTNMSSVHHDQISMAPDFPPAHDFTAGPAGAGYVDMHRGPSPAPGQYGVGAGAGAYGGHYETPNPNPYDAYDYNSGYGQRRY